MDESDSKRFASEVESRILALGRRIADFADLSLKYSDLEQKYNSLNKEIDITKENIHLSKDLEEEKHKSILEIISSNESSIKSIKDIQDQISNNNKSIDSKINVIFDNISEIKKEVKSIRENASNQSFSISEIQFKMSEVNSNVYYLQEYRNNSTQESYEIDRKISDLYSISEYIKKQQVYIDDKYKYILESINSSVSNLNNQIGSNLGQMNECVSQFKNEIISNYKSIKIPDISNLSSVQSVNDLKHSVNVSILDSQNAISKTNNLDMQIQILSKKIEGIQIQLKANELGQR